jgi:TolA-binding protein
MTRFTTAIVASITVLAIGGCASIEGDWKTATTQNTVAAYQTFLKENPKYDGPLRTDAQARIEAIEFQQAKAAGDKESLVGFLARHPNGAHAGDAKQIVAYKDAVAANSEPAYVKFLSAYPNSEFGDDINSRLRKVRYNDALTENSIPAYEKFLTLYKQGPDVDEVTKLLDPLTFAKATETHTEKGYQDFLSRFPNSASAPDASERLRRVVYLKTITAKTVAGYEDFIKRYPQGQDSEIAGKLLETLKAWEASKEKELGVVALRMAPSASIGGTGGASSTMVPSPTLKEDLAKFKELLKAGAIPSRVRIANFVPAGFTTDKGAGEFHPTSSGTVVQADEDGTTLADFFKATKLKEASALLAKYGRGK